jgi:hypothetical protein
MISKLIFVWVIITIFATIVSCDETVHNHQEEEQAILEKLTKNYNVNIRPASTNLTVINGPTVVTINMFVLNIQRIDEVEGTWKMQVFYRQEWNDKRLAYESNEVDFKYLTLIDLDSIWTPDIFFTNEIHAEVHNLMKRNILVRVKPNGDVLFSTRITLTLFCQDARATPHKSEIVCSSRQASYAYTNDDIVIVWKEVNPVQLSDKIAISNFVFKSVDTKSCDSTTNTGTYSCARADFTFRRSECTA